MRSTATTLATVDMEDDKVLTKLATEATNLNLDDVANTITLVKVGETDKESVKRLKAAYVKPLTRTYAFLMNLKEDDEEVTKFTRPGLAERIFYNLKQLMPKGCKSTKGTRCCSSSANYVGVALVKIASQVKRGQASGHFCVEAATSKLPT